MSKKKMEAVSAPKSPADRANAYCPELCFPPVRDVWQEHGVTAFNFSMILYYSKYSYFLKDPTGKSETHLRRLP